MQALLHTSLCDVQLLMGYIDLLLELSQCVSEAADAVALFRFLTESKLHLGKARFSWSVFQEFIILPWVL